MCKYMNLIGCDVSNCYFNTTTKNLKFIYQAVQMQTNEIDCGVFAITFTVSLLFKDDVTLIYIIDDMRLHLLNLLNNELISRFSIISNHFSVSKNNSNDDENICRMLFYDEGIDENVYREINSEYDVNTEKSISVEEEI